MDLGENWKGIVVIVNLESVSDVHLLALMKVMLQARFDFLSQDELWASPYVADVHVDIIEEYKDRCRSPRPGSLIRFSDEEELKDWLVWERYSFQHWKVIEYLQDSPILRSAILIDPNVIREWLRPWSVSDEILEEFVSVASEDHEEEPTERLERFSPAWHENHTEEELTDLRLAKNREDIIGALWNLRDSAYDDPKAWRLVSAETLFETLAQAITRLPPEKRLNFIQIFVDTLKELTQGAKR